MSAKRLGNSPKYFGIALGLALSAGAANAQLSGGQWRAPAQSTGGSARAVEKKQEPTTIFAPAPGVFPRQPIAFTLVPAIVMSDGSVLADFGFGYEPVQRSCGGGLLVGGLSSVQVGQPVVVAGNGVVISQGSTPYMQPAPNQQTASQQFTAARVGSLPAQTSCFNRDATGRISVYRF